VGQNLPVIALAAARGSRFDRQMASTVSTRLVDGK